MRRQPGRVVASAKSWLSVVGADRSGPILPWGAPADVPRLSPVDTSAAYLAHLRAAWDASMPAPLTKQEVYLAVPASFDAVARDLTMRAADAAGLPGARLIEEPQAAFYAWVAATRGGWRRSVEVGDAILVCDVGGGTTDLSLVGVAEEKGELVRAARGRRPHPPGGDNMDLALAHAVRTRLADEKRTLDEWQFRGLVHACREAKERLLAEDAPARQPVVVLGRSRKVVGGAVRTDVGRDDVASALVDGLFPVAGADERPREARRSGLQEIGLPYAADPAITRHVAAFLARHREVAPAGPSAVLFNGGVMKAAGLRARMLEVLAAWRGAACASSTARIPTSPSPRGGRLRPCTAWTGVRIRGGTARAYYVGVETPAPALPGVPAPLNGCVAPFGMEEGTEVELPGMELGLVVGLPAEFRFFGSSVHRADRPGTVVEGWNAGEVEELSPLEVTLAAEGAAGTSVPVRLHAHLTEIGTLELWCVAREGDRRWKVEFNVRHPG